MKSASSQGLFPPNPSIRSSDDTAGQRLLTMLRTLEKEEDGELMKEFVDVLTWLTAKALRNGVLSGDAQQANHILAATAGARKRNRNSRDARPAVAGSNEPRASEPATAHDGQLLISAICRILDSASRKSSLYNQCWDMLVKLAADFLGAWACFVASQRTPEQSVIAEYELLALNGKQILSLLCNTCGPALVERIPSTDCLRRASANDHDDRAALLSCIRASASLSSLFGTKLARSVQLVKELHEFALKTLSVTDKRVVEASAELIATLPCAGGIDGATPMTVWEFAIRDCVAAIVKVVRAVVPLNALAHGTDTTETSPDSQLSRFTTSWLEEVRATSVDTARVEVYKHLLSSLCAILAKLLGSPPALAGPGAVTSTLNVASLLEVAEMMISSPITAENVYNSTKKRLRLEAVGDCLFSPATIANQLANQLKFHGLVLITTLMESIGGPSLTPIADRFKKIIATSLLNSASMSIRGVIDPTSIDIHADGRKRWLYLSVFLRTQSVIAFHACLQAFGGDLSSSVSHGSRHSLSVTERGVFLVGGNVIEALTTVHSPSSQGWGGFRERSDLLTASLSCLGSALSSGGEYMTENLRQFVDSVAKRALVSLANGDAAVASASCKVAIISLGIACVLTSWPDGSLSWLVHDMLSVARQFYGLSKINTVISQAIAVCNSALSPRVPALLIRVADRKLPVQGSRRGVSVETIEEAVERDLIAENSTSLVADEPVTASTVNKKTTKQSVVPLVTKTVVKSLEPGEARKRPIHQISAEGNKSALPMESKVDVAEQLPEGRNVMDTEEEDGNFEFPNIVDMGPDEGDADDE